MGGRAWTAEEVARLRALAAQGLSYPEIASRLGRSVHSVRIKARQLDIRRRSRKWWTEEEEERLRELLKKHSLSEIARLLGRTKSSVATKVWELGLATEHYNGLRNASNVNTNVPEWVRGYVAGLLDGEGVVSIVSTRRKDRKNGMWKPIVDITNTCKEALEFIIKQIGGFRFSTKKGVMTPHSRKPVYRIMLVRHKDVLEFLEMVMPYLIIKRRQAELVVEFCKSRLAKPNHAPYDEREKEIIAEVKRLNKR
jgi:DNA-binding CsgD family transcriptional regulator